MFDFGFSEVLLTSVIALIVLGPEKLPRAASQVGRWVGRARAMARQFREQLEEEVNLENVKKAHKEEEARRESEAKQAGGTAGTNTATGQSQDAGQNSAPGQGATQGPDAASGQGTAMGHDPTAAAGQAASGLATESPYTQPAATPNASFGDQISPDLAKIRADTYSHMHPADEIDAYSLTPNRAPEAAPIVSESAPHEASAHAPIELHASASGTVSPPQDSGGSEHHRPDGGGAYASASDPAPVPTTPAPPEAPATAHSLTPPEKSGPV